MKKCIIFFVILIISCTKDIDEVKDELPYFSFITEDNNVLLNLDQVGKILTFKNQNNDNLLFEVVTNKKEKQLHSKGNWVYASYSEKYFYYDQKTIALRCTLPTPDLIIKINRWPTSFSDGRDGIGFSVSKSSKMVANINVDTFNSSEPSIYFEYTYSTETMIINGFTYNNVLKIEIQNSQFTNPGWLLPKINFLYFDFNKGVIGFDDINNNEWRLQN
ncbi:MAG: hypothetical protein H7174_13690 [Flavobacterium sp.]|nr:hypothetical protein [Flavobacterium sp.]